LRLLLDTNVLLLLIAGQSDPRAIGGKKLKNFDLQDFRLVQSVAQSSRRHISTPHILTEVSNHLGDERQPLVTGGSIEFAQYINALEEIHVPARALILVPEFHALGLTDTAIFHLVETDTKVVSVDFHLCNRLEAKGIKVVNPRNSR
jgi:hypothetical protein